MLDPRVAAIDARLEGVRRIVAVTGGKGGIGKSVVSSALALASARAGHATGILDLDLTSPSDHVILGFPVGFPAEEFGIDPADHFGIRCMSIAHFAGDAPAPLRGGDVTNALLELLAITRWKELDLLVIDMPPGLGDAALDAMRLLKRAEYLVVAGASRLVLVSVRRTVRLMQEVGVPILGVVENMRRGDDDAVVGLAAQRGLPVLGALPFDDALEDALGDVEALAQTPTVRALGEALLPVLYPSAESRST